MYCHHFATIPKKCFLNLIKLNSRETNEVKCLSDNQLLANLTVPVEIMCMFLINNETNKCMHEQF